MRVLLLGASGLVGRAVLPALLARGHSVKAFVRPGSAFVPAPHPFVTVETGQLTEADLAPAVWGAEAVVSCLGSRSGHAGLAWAVNHDAHLLVLTAAESAGVSRFVFVSSICVQAPELAFQRALLAFEHRLRAARIGWTVVRPTVCFPAMTGQLARLRAGKPYLVAGDGRRTATKPISPADLGRFIAACLDDPEAVRQVLPVGGPGPAVTPRQVGAELCRLLGRPARFRSVPLWVLDGAVTVLAAWARLSPSAGPAAERARIRRHYLTRSRLVRDPVTGRCDPDATPEFGAAHLFDHLPALVRGETAAG